MSELEPIFFEHEGPTETDLVEWPAIDHSNLTAGAPVQRGHTYFDDDTGTLTCGVWECTPMTTKLRLHAVNEFMYIHVRKIFCIFQPKEATADAQAAR